MTKKNLDTTPKNVWFCWVVASEKCQVLSGFATSGESSIL